jgi:glycosyltransferase involved in cell wall biosynthesis
MRIALVQDHLRVGGTERQTVALANAFSAAGHEVLLLTFRPGGPLTASIDPRVPRTSLLPVDLRLDWFAPGLARALRAFSPDVVQLMGRMANAHGWRLRSALPDAAIVATFRTGKSVPRLYRRTLVEADAVVANCTEGATRLARTCGITGPKVHVIRNGIAPLTDPPPDSRAAIRTALGTSAEAVVFLCVAMMRRGKGHRDLVRIAAGLQLDGPWELWLAGDGAESAACRRLARKAGLVDRVRFLGLRNDTASLIGASDVAVLASHTGFEALPNFLVEAQWLGRPAITYDVGGAGEAIVPGESGLLVPEGDEAAFRVAMAQLARDTEARECAGNIAREFTRREFDSARQTQRYLEVFAALR